MTLHTILLPRFFHCRHCKIKLYDYFSHFCNNNSYIHLFVDFNDEYEKKNFKRQIYLRLHATLKIFLIDKNISHYNLQSATSSGVFWICEEF